MSKEEADKKSDEMLKISSKKPKIVDFTRFNKGANKNNKIGHEEIYHLITGDEISWKAIIYELIRSEQLDPLDIDITLLTKSFLDKIRQLEEHNFFISGKVLLAASFLLKMKADRVYNQLEYFDELLFGKKEHEIKEQEKYYISQEELPLILPKTPLPRARKVTIEELMKALNRAIEVETRRHKKHDLLLDAEREAAVVLPRERINITEKIKEIYQGIKNLFLKQASKRLTFSELAGQRKEDKIATFIPLLHLDTRQKITLEQKKPFDEIYIYLFKKQREEQTQ